MAFATPKLRTLVCFARAVAIAMLAATFQIGAVSDSSASAEATWSVIDPPPPRAFHSAVFDPVADRLLVFGGFAEYSISDELWTYRLGTGRWTRLPTTGPRPRMRRGHSLVLDPDHQRLVLFGGWDGDKFLADVWEFSLKDLSWREVTPAGPGPSARSEHSAIFDVRRNSLIIFGGYDDQDLQNEVWSLSFSGVPRWTRLEALGDAPRARHSASLSYDRDHDRAILVGGWDGQFEMDTWILSLGPTVSWRHLLPTGSIPAPRKDHQAEYVPTRNEIWVFGGQSDETLGDVNILSLDGGGAWRSAAPEGLAPRPRRDSGMALDPLSNRVLLYGGWNAGSLNDLWALSLNQAPAWTQLQPRLLPPPAAGIPDPRRAVIDGDRLILVTGTQGVWTTALASLVDWAPLLVVGDRPPLRGASVIFDAEHRCIITFGGVERRPGQIDAASNDVWALSLGGENSWVRLSPSGALPPPREHHDAIYDPARHRMITFGGYEFDYSTGHSEYRNDTWALSLSGEPTWTQLEPSGPLPEARFGHSTIYDPDNDRMLVFGGIVPVSLYGADLRNDLWALALDGEGAWSNITPTGPLPEPRALQMATYDTNRKRMLIHAGYNASYLGPTDVWAFQSTEPSGWRQVSTDGPSAMAADIAVTFDALRDRLIEFSDDDEFRLLSIVDSTPEDTSPVVGGVQVGIALPNPARQATSLQFALPRRARVNIGVFDLAGRRVAQVLDTDLSNGAHRVMWMGGSEAGSRASAGLYFFRLVIDGRSYSRRFVLLP
jgi:hypothetical protein